MLVIFLIPVLETVNKPLGTSSVIENTDLNSGSSKQGNARLASVLSNCVVPILWSTPLSSLYLDR